MKRSTVFLDEGLESDLDAIARRKGCARAAVIRDALARYVEREKQSGRARPSFVAMGASGYADTAENHERLLFRDAPSPPPTRLGARSSKIKPARKKRTTVPR